MSDREKILAEAEKRMIDFMEKAHEVCETNVNLSSQYSALVSEYGCFISFIKNLPEEPTSSDLEEVAANYEEEMWKGGHPENTYTSSDIIKAVMYGANWQKQQIMRGAVDVTVELGKIKIDKSDLEKLLLPFFSGDKAKLIICKL